MVLRGRPNLLVGRPTSARASRATRLTITERNLPSQKAKETSEEGWKVALMGLKHLLEA